MAVSVTSSCGPVSYCQKEVAVWMRCKTVVRRVVKRVWYLLLVKLRLGLSKIMLESAQKVVGRDSA